jgi:hypothetical protein
MVCSKIFLAFLFRMVDAYYLFFIYCMFAFQLDSVFSFYSNLQFICFFQIAFIQQTSFNRFLIIIVGLLFSIQILETYSRYLNPVKK